MATLLHRHMPPISKALFRYQILNNIPRNLLLPDMLRLPLDLAVLEIIDKEPRHSLLLGPDDHGDFADLHELLHIRRIHEIQRLIPVPQLDDLLLLVLEHVLLLPHDFVVGVLVIRILLFIFFRNPLTRANPDLL